ncbi:outer membrane receptor protein [Flammeovirgaceae bacterium 311]|nr:outer membrane receptor protein [Flammeovirgaceae bacterium 311]
MKYLLASAFLLFSFLAAFTPVGAFAQSGTIRGQIIDGGTGEPLLGATVQIDGTSIGSITDLDGKYTIKTEPGTVNLRVSYISYSALTIRDVAVKADEVTVVDARLVSAEETLQEIVVEAKALRDNETALLTMQKKSAVVLDGISAQQFSRSGDSDAAAAIRRITGVSVQGGKYVYVRGLGDRYTKTSLNSAQIPGLDPDKNTIQMDLFPSNLVDNIVVYKTFSPELPGSFSGGYVDITTKDFPNQFTLQFSGTIGYNENASFNDNFLTHTNSSPGFLGLTASDRAMPDVLKGDLADVGVAFSSPSEAQLLDRQSDALQGGFAPQAETSFTNHSFSLSVGNQKNVFKRPLGFVGGFSYQKSYDQYSNGQRGYFLLPGTTEEPSLDTTQQYSVYNNSTESVLWGAIFNTSYKISPNHKLGVNLMYNHSADGSTTYQQGVHPYHFGTNDPSKQIEARALAYTQRGMATGQVKGEHRVTSRNIKINWLGSYTKLNQDEPDLRFFNNFREVVGENTVYNAVNANLVAPSRYFRDMDETNTEGKVDVEIPFLYQARDAKVKVGGTYLERERDFNERILQYRQGTSPVRQYQGDSDAYFATDNLGWNPNGGSSIFIRDETDKGGTYYGLEKLPAAYAMIDLPVTSSFRVSGGVRYEQTNIFLNNVQLEENDPAKYAHVKGGDFLPGVNITKTLMDNMNLRLGYGRTVARPNFRELSLFTTFPFLGAVGERGNPDLKRVKIDNLDIRWEYYPIPTEYLSVSLFYKSFKDPIERVFNPLSQDLAQEINYRNVSSASVYGLELEVRKDLAFIGDFFRNFRTGVNASLIYSAVDIDPQELETIRLNDPDRDESRPMYGQSPYLINSYLSYESETNRIAANLVYNVYGRRLAVIGGFSGIPDVYEQPRNTLDFNIKKGIGKHLAVKLAAQNLLNARYKETHEFKGEEYIYKQYQVGRTYSVGFTYLIE